MNESPRPVVVIGGGVMGSALAYWLTRLDPSLKVTVIERDFSYTQASSALSAASIRQQFSASVNIRISQASIAFLRKASEELQCGEEKPDIMLREHGYLYLAGLDGAAHLRAAHIMQKTYGSPRHTRCARIADEFYIHEWVFGSRYPASAGHRACYRRAHSARTLHEHRLIRAPVQQNHRQPSAARNECDRLAALRIARYAGETAKS